MRCRPSPLAPCCIRPARAWRLLWRQAPPGTLPLSPSRSTGELPPYLREDVLGTSGTYARAGVCGTSGTYARTHGGLNRWVGVERAPPAEITDWPAGREAAGGSFVRKCAQGAHVFVRAVEC